jgi:hypothetical protein
MLLSRFWYVVMAVALGAVTFALYLSASMYDRASVRAMGEALAGDSQVVASFLRDDARKRATSLIVPALDEDIRTHLAKSSDSPEKIPNDSKERVRAALKKQFNAIPAELKFDAMFAVDQAGRVVAQVGFDQASGIENFELGGYPVVADALHGWIRDDSWVLGGRIYRVVGRPVENDVSRAPAGAIIGVRILDDGFARELSRKTGAAIGFYANGARISSGAPEGFDTAQLDTITSDLKGLDNDPAYKEKGFSDVRTIHDDLGVVYARLVGEAWDMGAGYAVARTAHLIGSPLGFLHAADDKDKRTVPLALILIASLVCAGVGLGLSFVEHTRPLSVFRSEAERFGKGSSDQLTPSKFRGIYRQIASHLNDGMEKVAAKGGAPRRAADLDAVLGPMPAQPAMSAFSLPQDLPSSGAAPPPSGPATPARAPSFPNVPAAAPAGPPQPPAPKPPTPVAAAAPPIAAAPPAPRRSCRSAAAAGPEASHAGCRGCTAHRRRATRPPSAQADKASGCQAGLTHASWGCTCSACASSAVGQAHSGGGSPRERSGAFTEPRTRRCYRASRAPLFRRRRSHRREPGAQRNLGAARRGPRHGSAPSHRRRGRRVEARLRRVRSPEKGMRRADRRPELRQVQEHAA